MIEIFTSNSVAFLGALARWLLTPVPLTFVGLGCMCAAFSLARRLLP